METLPKDINDYLRAYGTALGDRVLREFPPLHHPNDPVWPEIERLRRKPYPAQLLCLLGVVKRWEKARTAAVIAECGTGKTLISLGAVHTSARGSRYTALAMVPPQLVLKWAKESFLTVPGARVFIIDGIRNDVSSNGYAGVNEVRLRNGRIVREGLHTTLSDLRLRKDSRSARARWDAICHASSIFIVSRERAKLGYFWRHVYGAPRSGPFIGCVVNPDTGRPVLTGTDQLRRADFKKAKHGEFVCAEDLAAPGKARRPFHSALWQADGSKVQRYAPMDFIGRYLADGFFDYGIADEVHELKGDTAQGNALGTLARCADRIAILTGTLLGGYADELFNILFRLDARKMVAEGFEAGDAGLRAFSEAYGVIEKVTVIQPEDNACSEARVTKRVRRRPGASPLLFGRFLMDMGAFVSLEDISDALPPYEEEVISVEMDSELRAAYEGLEKDIKEALQAHKGNQSVISAGMNALLLYPDRPFRLGDLIGHTHDEATCRREPFLISSPPDLDEEVVYAKERRLLAEIKAELAQGRRCQVYAVYTQKRDVTRRWRDLLAREGIRVELLTTEVPPEAREAWYERQLRNGMQVCICHPKLVQTGLDLLDFPTLIFGQTGYSIYVLRQASRRSWRIGQRRPVKVKFLQYTGTMQESCLRLMGKKLLVSLAMEGKFAAEGLQALEDDDDMLTAMARELVTQKGVGEKADQVWRELQASRAAAMAPAPAIGAEVAPIMTVEPAPGLVLPEPVAPAPSLFGLTPFSTPPRRVSRRGSYQDESQLSLAF
jgi:superfamily II DNA or RNA helicase